MSKFGHNASRTSANINRAGGVGFRSNWVVRKWFQAFYIEGKSYEDK